MPFFSLHSPFDESVEKATPSEVPGNDNAIIGRFLPVCDKVNEYPAGTKAKTSACSDCLRSVWKRIKNPDPLIGLHAVALLDFLVKNCGVQFLGALDDRDFVLKMRDFVKTKLEDQRQNNRQVAEALKARIQDWAEGELKHITWIPFGPMEERKKERSNVRGLYNIMRRQGFSFPILRSMKDDKKETMKDATRESDIERREREELEMALRASLEVQAPPPSQQQQQQQHTMQQHQYCGLSAAQQTSASPTWNKCDAATKSTTPLYPRVDEVQPGATPRHATDTTPRYVTDATPRHVTDAAPSVVEALYDFEAIEDDELTIHAGDVINVTEATDANWWRGESVKTGRHGFFPASFVTTHMSIQVTVPDGGRNATDERNKNEGNEKGGKIGNEAETKTTKGKMDSTAKAILVDEEKIKTALHLIQQTDPSKTDAEENEFLEQLESECMAMGPLIDKNLERTDKRHLEMMELNKKLADAIQMYHFLMISENQVKDQTIATAYPQSAPHPNV